MSTSPASCPMKNQTPTPNNDVSKCPVTTQLNPLNQIPTDLANTPLDLEDGSPPLPQSRTSSSIPSSDNSTWVYPSPQQFYNALRRKGFETPKSEVGMMVSIHNYLNEQAWAQILNWESMHSCPTPKLVKLVGRPNDYSPKSIFAHYVYGTPRPFDRHDWFVDRCGKQVRYVIDYYSGPDEPNDTPVFFLDVRPALDSPTSLMDRMRHALRNWMNKNPN